MVASRCFSHPNFSLASEQTLKDMKRSQRHHIAPQTTFLGAPVITFTVQFCSRICIEESSRKPIGLELNGKSQLFVYDDDVNILGANLQTVMKNTEISIKASKDIGLEVNSEKTKYINTSRNQNVV